jgi:hypothetical protein
LALLNLVVNIRDTPRVGDKLAILTRNIKRDRARIHRWLKRRNFASSGQSLLRDKQDERSYRVCRATNRKIGGLPIGVKGDVPVDVELGGQALLTLSH